MILYCLYVIISPLLWLLLIIVSLFQKKIRQRLLDYKKLLVDVKKKVKTTTKEIIVFHSASNGELEQLKPIFRGINKNKYFILLTISSPSSINHIPKNSIDAFCYQPFDFPWSVYNFFRCIRPNKYIITRHDIWPNHIVLSIKFSCKLFLINANLPKSSKRKNPIFISLYKFLFSKFNQIHTMSAEIKNEIGQFVENKNIVKISGDTRIDQILYRKNQINRNMLPKCFSDSKNILFGSIETMDIKIIFESISEIHNNNIKYIFVPHEIDENLIKKIESELLELNLLFCRYSKMDTNNNLNAIIIDRVGILAELYAYSTISYIGCGFSRGVHNVIEPAVYGNLICFGPKYHILNEAIEMIDKNLAYAISSSSELIDILNKIFNKNYIEKQSSLMENYINSKSVSSDNIINEIL